MDSLGARIEGVRKSLGLTQSAFADKLSVKQGVISKWERNESEPESLILAAIASLGFTSIDWLVTGIDKKKVYGNISELASTVSEPKGHWYKIVGRVMAGTAVLFEENVVGEIYIDYYKQNGCFAVMVEGDSMTKETNGINPGDIALVDPDQTPVSGDIVVAVYSGRQVIKQLAITREGSELRSWNPIYPSIPIDSSELEIMYRVVLIQPKPIKL